MALAALKTRVRETFPSLWLTWRALRRPKSAEREIRYLRRFISKDDVTVDIGANLGLYTRELSRLSAKVHAFEPTGAMAELLRRTSAANVAVHQLALSDAIGETEIFVPRRSGALFFSIASLEQDSLSAKEELVPQKVTLARLDDVLTEPVRFIKIDVEGHELHVLNGARQTIARHRPIFLVEAQDQSKPGATGSVFDFFGEWGYRGYFLIDDEVYDVTDFDLDIHQNAASLLPDGGRAPGRFFVNNFFFFPPALDGRSALVN